MTTIDEIVEHFGFGRFGVALVFTSASLWIVSGAEITLIAVLSSQLRCHWALSSAQTAMLSNAIFIGMAIGSLFMGWISDKTGRKSVTITMLVLLLYFGLLCAAAPSLTWLFILRIFVGIGTSVEMTGPLYIVEFLGRKYRAKAVVMNSIFFAAGNIYSLLLAYIILPVYGWRVYVLLVVVPVPFILMLVVWLPESIRVLKNTDNYDILMKTLARISKMNNVPLPREIDINTRPSSRRGSIRILRKFYSWTTMMSFLLTVAANINLYGILFLSTEVFSINFDFSENLLNNGICTYIEGTDFLQSSLVCIGAILGSIIMCLLVDVIGRKASMIICFSICTCFFAVSAFSISVELMIGLLFVSRTFADPLIQLSWVFVAENHPVVIRGTVMGISALLTNIAVLTAPILIQWIFHLSKIYTAITFIVISLVGIGSIILMPPENKNESIDITRK